MTRRQYRELNRKQSGSPTLESFTRRKPSRRYFKSVSTGAGFNIPPLWIGTLRQFVCNGPFNDDSGSGHSVDWWLDTVQALNYYSARMSPQWTYFELQNLTRTPTLRKMKPIRYTLAAPTYALPGFGGMRHYQQRIPHRVQNSTLSPPATASGHFSGSRVSSIGLTAGTFSSTGDNSGSRVVKGRVWIDGADVSGIVSMNHGFAPTLRSNGGGAYYSTGLSIPLSSPVTVSDAKTIAFDLWVENRMSGTNYEPMTSSTAFPTFATNNPPGFPADAPVIAAHGTHDAGGVPNQIAAFQSQPVMTSGDINVHRRLTGSELWNCVFTTNNVGGVASLELRPQANWSFSRQGAVIRMVKTGGTNIGDTVELRYDTETPEVLLILPRNPASHGGDSGGSMRYNIQSGTLFGPVGPASRRFSPLTVTGSNTFTAVARGIYRINQNTNGYLFLEGPTIFPATATIFPPTVVVSRV